MGLLTVPPIALLGVAYGRFVKGITEKIYDAYADSTQVASERLGSMRTVHSFGQEKLEKQLFADSVASVLSSQFKEVKAKAAFYSMVSECLVFFFIHCGACLATRVGVGQKLVAKDCRRFLLVK